MLNIWTELKNTDIINTMRLAGCAPKYTNGQASDFECFCAWCACLPLLEGNVTAERFAAELGRALKKNTDISELKNALPNSLWCEYNTKKYGVEYSLPCDEKINLHSFLHSENYSDEKLNIFSKAVDINSCLSRGFDICTAEEHHTENGCNYCTVGFFDGEFLRPDRYNASQIASKLISGEKCKNSEKNLLLAQNICEIAYQKKCRKIYLYIKSCGSHIYAEQLIKYFSLRGFCLRIYFKIEENMSAEEAVSLCMLSDDKIFITPVISRRVLKNKINFREELAKIYPSALVCIED